MCMHRESQTLTAIFLLKHNYSPTWLKYTISILQNYCKKSSLSYPMIYMKVFIISLLDIHHFGTKFISCANYHCYYQSHKKIQVKHESAIISSKKFNSQNNLSEAWECISLKCNHINSQNNISEAWDHISLKKNQLSKWYRWSKRVYFFKI